MHIKESNNIGRQWAGVQKRDKEKLFSNEDGQFEVSPNGKKALNGNKQLRRGLFVNFTYPYWHLCSISVKNLSDHEVKTEFYTSD